MADRDMRADLNNVVIVTVIDANEKTEQFLIVLACHLALRHSHRIHLYSDRRCRGSFQTAHRPRQTIFWSSHTGPDVTFLRYLPQSHTLLYGISHRSYALSFASRLSFSSLFQLSKVAIGGRSPLLVYQTVTGIRTSTDNQTIFILLDCYSHDVILN